MEKNQFSMTIEKQVIEDHERFGLQTRKFQ
jgi:hypothetical protein